MRYITAHDASEVIPVIREALRDSGITQRVMAEHLGFSTKHMSAVMTGKGGATFPTVFRMLDYLDLTLVLSPKP